MLMPNMCNYNKRWNVVKNILARKWGELTLLWYCGYEQRLNAISNGIYSWKDKKYNSHQIVSSMYKKKIQNIRFS
jgi:hypothetical protein